MPEAIYIAVDLGAESGRVITAKVGTDGVTLKQQNRFPNEPVRVGSTLYWDILSLWRGVKTGIGMAIRDDRNIRGIGVDTWGVDFGLLDHDGDLIGNPVHYRDERTNGVPELFFSRMPRAHLYSIAGIQTMSFNTLFQLTWMAEHRARVLDQAKFLLYIPDLLNYWLCGHIGNEYTIASTSQMLDARTRQYAAEILRTIPLRSTLLPSITTPGSVLGPMLPGTLDISAAPEIPVIAVGSHDTASAVIGVPGEGDDWLFISSGTWSLLGAEINQPVLTPRAAQLNLTNEGGVGGTIRLIKNIPGMWLLQECRRAWAADGHDYDYASLVRMAADAPAHRAIINPDHPPFSQPGEMPRKIVDYCRQTGQAVPDSPGSITRVILESLAAAYARVAEMIAEVTGRKFSRIHIVGGGSQNDLLNVFTANATGMTVLAGPVEATAIGNVITQAIAGGQLSSIAEGRRLVARTGNLREFIPRETETWRALADRYRHLFADQAKE
jgi:rhamnulokinase